MRGNRLVKARISQGDGGRRRLGDCRRRDAQQLGRRLLFVAGTERAVALRRLELGEARRLGGLPVGRLRGRRDRRGAESRSACLWMSVK